MRDVFISYARKDNEPDAKGFITRLRSALDAAELNVWMDKSKFHYGDDPNAVEAIRFGDDFMESIHGAIRESNTFLFVISPNSVKSEVCGKEVAYAVERNKRLITVLREPVLAVDVPESLQKINWIEALPTQDEAAAFQKIIDVLRSGDQDYFQKHTWLIERSERWQQRSKQGSLSALWNGFSLLQGQDLRDAEEWLEKSRIVITPKPTQSQEAFIKASQQGRATRQRALIAALTVGLVIALVLSALAIVNADRADRNAAVAVANAATAERRAVESNSLALAANAQIEGEDDTALAVALALQSNNIANPPALSQRILSRFAYEGGQELARIYGSDNGRSTVNVIAVSPDGRMFATGTFSGVVRIWDATTYDLLDELTDSGFSVSDMKFTNDNRQLLVGRGALMDSRSQLTLWLLRDGDAQATARELVGSVNRINSIAVSPDGIHALSTDDDGFVIIWDLNTAEEVGRFQPLGSMILWLTSVFSEDGSAVLSTSAGTRHLDIRTLTGEFLDRVPLQLSRLGCLTFLLMPGGDEILCAIEATETEPGIYRMDRRTGAITHIYQDVGSPVYSLALSADGRRFLALTNDDVRLWAVDELLPSYVYANGGSPLSKAAKFSIDGTRVMTNLTTRAAGAGESGAVLIWDATFRSGAALTDQSLLRLRGAVRASALAYTPDSTALVIATGGGLSLIDVATGSELRRFVMPEALISDIAPLPDGSGVLASTYEGILFRWDFSSLTPIWIAQAYPEAVAASSLAISPDGRYALTGGRNGEIKLWNAASGELLRAESVFVSTALNVAFSPDGMRMAAGGCMEVSDGSATWVCADNLLVIWDVETGDEDYRLQLTSPISVLEPIRLLSSDADAAEGACNLEPTGAFADYWLVKYATDLLQTVNIETSERECLLVGHQPTVLEGGFSVGQQIGVTGDTSGQVLVWNVARGEAFRRIDVNGTLWLLALAPDGKTAATVTDQTTTDGLTTVIDIWRIDRQIDDLLSWTYANRQPRALSCAERIEFNVMPLCDQQGQVPTPTAVDTLLATQAVTAGSPEPTLTLRPTRTTLPTFTPSPTLLPTLPLPTRTPTAREVNDSSLLGSAAVYMPQWSPDGMNLITAGFDGTVRVWDSFTGAIRFAVSIDRSRVEPPLALLSPGGQWIALAEDTSIHLIDTSSGKRGYTLEAPASVTALAWSPDGSRLAGGSDSAVLIWEASTGEALFTLDEVSSIRQLAWSPDGDWVAVGGASLQIWNTSNGELRNTLQEDAMLVSVDAAPPVPALVWSADGTYLAASGQGTVWVWGDHANAFIASEDIVSDDGAIGIWFSPDDTRLLLAGTLPGVWTIEGDQMVKSFDIDSGIVTSAAWSPSGDWLITSSLDGTARLWDGATGELVRTFEHGASILGAAISSDGLLLSTTGEDGTVRLWNTRNGREQAFAFPRAAVPPTATGSPKRRSDKAITPTRKVQAEGMEPVEGGLYGASWSPDGTKIMATGANGTLWIWDAFTGASLLSLDDMDVIENLASRAAWSPDGTRIAAANWQNMARVLDPVTGEIIATLRGHTEPVTRVRWSPDGTQIATASDDLTMRVWDATTGEVITIYRGQGDYINDVQWSPDGTQVISTSDDGTGKVWDAATGAEIYELIGRNPNDFWMLIETPPQVIAGRWSPDGTLIATGRADGVVIIWDAATGTELGALYVTQTVMNFVFDLFWSHDGKRLIVTTFDERPTVWDVTLGEFLYHLDGQEDLTILARWSPDDSMILVPSFDDTLRVWDAKTGEPLLTIDGRADITWAEWSPDGTLILTSAIDGTVRIWDAVTGREQVFLFSPAVSQFESDQSILDACTRMLVTMKLEEILASIQDETSPAAVPGTQAENWIDRNSTAWQYAGAAGEVITLCAYSSVPITMQLLNPDGVLLETAADVNESKFVGIYDYILPVDGTYTIDVSGTTTDSAAMNILFIDSSQAP